MHVVRILNYLPSSQTMSTTPHEIITGRPLPKIGDFPEFGQFVVCAEEVNTPADRWEERNRLGIVIGFIVQSVQQSKYGY